GHARRRELGRCCHARESDGVCRGRVRRHAGFSATRPRLGVQLQSPARLVIVWSGEPDPTYQTGWAPEGRIVSPPSFRPFVWEVPWSSSFEASGRTSPTW